MLVLMPRPNRQKPYRPAVTEEIAIHVPGPAKG
jgi:hypothetical protein